MFRTAKTNTYRTEITGYRRIMRRIRIGTYLKTSIFIGKRHQFGEVTGEFGSLRFHLTIIYYTCTSVQ